MEKSLLNLQLFAEGGDGGAAGTGVGAEASGDAPGLQTVVGESDDGSKPLVTSNKGKDKSSAFEDLIKGEYAEEFNSRVHKIVEQRFEKQKELEAEQKALKPIVDLLTQKYGVDAKDPKALAKAVLEDDSYYEQEAMDRGLSVKQLKEIKAMERENAELKAMREQAEQQAKDEQFMSHIHAQAEEFAAKYGMEDFDVMKEAAENDDFRKLLSSGFISVEAAYMATHMDQVLGGAMAKTASAVRQGISENIQARGKRPSENGLFSNSAAVMKVDPSKLTREQRRELEARAARGERITFV